LRPTADLLEHIVNWSALRWPENIQIARGLRSGTRVSIDAATYLQLVASKTLRILRGVSKLSLTVVTYGETNHSVALVLRTSEGYFLWLNVFILMQIWDQFGVICGDVSIASTGPKLLWFAEYPARCSNLLRSTIKGSPNSKHKIADSSHLDLIPSRLPFFCDISGHLGSA